ALEESPSSEEALQRCIRTNLAVWYTELVPLRSPVLRHKSQVMAVAIGPDSKTFLTAGLGRAGQLWNAATGPLSLQEPPSNNLNAHVTILLQNQPFCEAACSSYFLTVPNGSVVAVSFSHDGTRALTAGHDGVARWDVTSGKRISPLFPRWQLKEKEDPV